MDSTATSQRHSLKIGLAFLVLVSCRLVAVAQVACPVINSFMATPLPAGAIAFWRLDEAVGVTRRDSDGTSDLADQNSVSQVAGRIGNAAGFASASGQRLSAADNPNLRVTSGDFTIAFWVKFNSLATSLIVAKDNTLSNAAQREFQIFLVNGKFGAVIYNNSSVPQSLGTVLASNSVSTGVWYFVAFRHDSVAKAYYLSVDGGPENSLSYSGTPNSGSGAAFTVSGFQTGGGFLLNGAMDALGIWKRRLSGAEIASLYNSGAGLEYLMPMPSLAVAALWADRATVGMWTDESPAHNDAKQLSGSFRNPAIGNDGQAFLRFGGEAALQFSPAVSVRTVFFIMRHRTGLQVETAPLSNSLTNGSEFSSGSYKHEGSLWYYPYATLPSNTSASVLSGRLWVNGIPITNPILTPKPRVMEVVAVETTALVSVNTLFNDRLSPGRSWDGDVCGMIAFDRVLSGAERDEMFSYAVTRCGVSSLPPLIAFYGDSITYGVSDWSAENCPDCAYPYQVTRQLNALGIIAEQVEFGVGSQSMQTVLDDFDSKTAPLLADTRRPRIVVLQGGGNGLLSYPGTLADKAAALFSVTRTIANKVHAAGGKIVVTTITPCDPSYLTAAQFDRAAFESARQTYNGLVRASTSFDVVSDAGADPQIGCPGCASDKDPVTTGYQNPVFVDGCHPNTVGNGILATRAVGTIRALLNR
jgi:lysophospholipase L1-like esterase